MKIDFEVGKLYSSEEISEVVEHKEVNIYGAVSGGSHGIHIKGDNIDLWFVMDKEAGYTGGDSFNYKCIYNE